MLAHLDELVIKPSFPPTTRQPVFGRTLSAEQKGALRSALLARPEDYVAQSEVALSTAPVWNGQESEPRQLVLRVYVASAGDSMSVMPGGLTRVGATSDIPIVTMQRGGGSKDTWVVSEGPVTGVSLLAPTRLSVRRERLDAELPSRVADNLFWLGRHIERAEQTARLLRSLVTYVTREDMSEDTPELVALLHVLADMELIPAPLRERDAAAASRAPVVAAVQARRAAMPCCARRWARCAGLPRRSAIGSRSTRGAFSISSSRIPSRGRGASSSMTCSCT